MTRDAILALRGRELDAAVAEQVFGLTLTSGYGGPRSGYECAPLNRPGQIAQLREYSSDADDCRLMEIQIGRLGLRAQYVRQLWGIMGGNLRDDDVYFRPVEIWDFMTTPLETRCFAALLAVMETEEAENVK